MEAKLCDCYIIHVTETKLENNISNADISFKSFKILKFVVRPDNGNGVLIYIRNNLHTIRRTGPESGSPFVCLLAIVLSVCFRFTAYDYNI